MVLYEILAKKFGKKIRKIQLVRMPKPASILAILESLSKFKIVNQK